MIALLLLAAIGLMPQHGMAHDRVDQIEFNAYGNEGQYRQIIFWRRGHVVDYRTWPESLGPNNPLIWRDGQDDVWRHVDAKHAFESLTLDHDREMDEREKVPVERRRKLTKPKP